MHSYMDYFLFVGFIVIPLHQQLVSGEGEVVIKLQRFVNPGGKGDNGNCCDGKWGFCESNGCDHFFTICLDNAIGMDSMSSCEYGIRSTNSVKNSDTISFGSSSIGGTENRFVFQFVSWPGSAKLKVDIHDKDKINGNDYVDTLKGIIVQKANEGKDVHTIRDRCSLRFEMEVICAENWRGEDCGTYCRPRDDNSGHYNCDENGNRICLPGWTGEVCDINYNECESSPCNVEGTRQCQDNINAYSCICLLGFTGNHCEEDVDECMDLSSCSGHGRCNNTYGSYECHCDNGYTGMNCSEEIDECISSPCNAAASCIDAVNSFKCLCPSGFAGVHCNIDIDECLSHGCLNNATCVDSNATYLCECLPGFAGMHCETELDECSSSPCQNGGNCTDQVNGYLCSCVDGWSGPQCSIDIDNCEQSPCIYGNCTDQINSYTCQCESGYEGVLCEVETDECFNVTCPGNHSHCVDLVGQYLCLCEMGWSGDNCSEPVDFCRGTVCLNNGTCEARMDGFTCHCMEPWIGITCNKSLDSCEESYCNSSGSERCIYLTEETYYCDCKEDWSGESCEVYYQQHHEASCTCATPTNNSDDIHSTLPPPACQCDYHNKSAPFDDQNSIDQPSAILFEGTIDAKAAQKISNNLEIYISKLLKTKTRDVKVGYSIKGCSNDEGGPIGVFVFDVLVKKHKLPYSYIDDLFELLLDQMNKSNAIQFPLPLSNGEECYKLDAQISKEESFPLWIIICSVLGCFLIILVIIIIVWRIQQHKTIVRSKCPDFEEPVLVEHISPASSETVILGSLSEGYPMGYALPGLARQLRSSNTSTKEELESTPKCFVNQLYEDLNINDDN